MNKSTDLKAGDSEKNTTVTLPITLTHAAKAAFIVQSGNPVATCCASVAATGTFITIYYRNSKGTGSLTMDHFRIIGWGV